MTFKLRQLTIENLGSFVTRTTVPFSREAINNIEGVYTSQDTQSNGAGKSLLIDAISLALFGKGIRANYLAEYISDKNPAGGIYLGLELEDAAGNILKAERWRRPGSDTNKAKVWYKGKDLSSDSTVSKIDDMIQSYIGISHTNFISSIFSVMVPGFLKLRPAQRFEILEQALALKKIESVIKKINTTIKSDEEKLLATREVIGNKQSLLLAEQTKKDIYTSNSETIKTNIAEYESELSSLLSEESALIATLNKWKTLLDDVLLKLSPIQQGIDRTSALIDNTMEDSSKVSLRLKTTLSALRRGKTGKIECAVCNSSLDESSKEAVKSHYETEMSLLEKKKEELVATRAEFLSKKEKLLLHKEKAELAVSTFTRQLNNSRSNILAIERSLVTSKEAFTSSQEAINPELLLELKKELLGLLEVKASLEKSLKISNAWKQAMAKNGLRLSYIKEEVSTLSALASRYASAVYETPMAIVFYINDEKDNPSLEFTVNGKNSGMMSTGESRRLEIAMTLSLMSLLKSSGMSLGFLILDEALDGLSLASKQAVLKVIDNLAAEYQIVMISHDPLIKARPGYTIQVVKDSTTHHSSVVTTESLLVA